MDTFVKLDKNDYVVGVVLCRPKFHINTTVNKIKILYDTGADSSVWCQDVGKLFEEFPDAHILPNVNASLNGFGKYDSQLYPVYIIPELKIGNIEFRNLPVVVKPSNMSVDLILQCSVFYRCPFCIDLYNRVMRIKDPEHPIIFKEQVKNGILIGTTVFFQVEEKGNIDFNIPDDFKEYADKLRVSVDELAELIFNTVPEVAKRESKNIVETALEYWDYYKKYFT